MATNVSISSNASLMLGGESINSFDEEDDSDVAKLAANLYDQVRDALLRAHNWNCAKKRIALAPNVSAPPFDYTYEFPLPDDWLRNIQVGQQGDATDFRVEGQKIVANDNPLYLVYVFRNTVEATWDSMLIQGMTLAMKAAMSYAITKSTTVKQDAVQELETYLKRARAVDGQDEPPEQLGDFMLYMAGF